MLPISLCIPTMRRWDFLKSNIPKYLNNSFIDEIVIVDETGEDYAILNEIYGTEPKIRLFKNNKQLGAFLNKVECIKHAANDWVCLIDSDNYASEDYFISFFRDINANPISNVIYTPAFAKPSFDFRRLEGKVINKGNISEFLTPLYKNVLKVALNVGNFIIHKSCYDIITNLIKTEPDVKTISEIFISTDVLFMNYLLLKNGFNIKIVPDMEYDHLLHEGNLCCQTQEKFKDIDDDLFSKICQLK
jgi:glycosyltransferase involved in cell wall biosynthesis